MTRLFLTSLPACLLLACATSRMAELLPESGMYQWDGTSVPSRKVRVVRDGNFAVLVWLKDNGGDHGLCLLDEDRSACERTLVGRHFASGYELRNDGIYELESDVLEVPARPRTGQEWIAQKGAVSNCVFVRRIERLDADSITISTRLRCPDEPERHVDTDLWLRSRGVVEIETSTGTKLTMRRAE